MDDPHDYLEGAGHSHHKHLRSPDVGDPGAGAARRLAVFAAGTGLIFVLSLFLQVGLHASPRDASLGLLPLTLGLIAAGFAAMGGPVAKLGRRLAVIGLILDLAGCGRQRQRLAQLDPAARFSDRIRRGRVDLLPGRNLRIGPCDEGDPYHRPGRHRPQPSDRRSDAPQGTARTRPLSSRPGVARTAGITFGSNTTSITSCADSGT